MAKEFRTLRNKLCLIISKQTIYSKNSRQSDVYKSFVDSEIPPSNIEREIRLVNRKPWKYIYHSRDIFISKETSRVKRFLMTRARISLKN